MNPQYQTCGEPSASPILIKSRGGKREGSGRKPRSTSRESITVRLEPEDAARLRCICLIRDISQADWIAEKIMEA